MSGPARPLLALALALLSGALARAAVVAAPRPARPSTAVQGPTHAQPAALAQQAPGAPEAPAVQTALASADEQRLARWREELELDSLETILAEGPALVSGAGALARSGEAVALVARALFRAGQEELARNLLEQARPSDADGASRIAIARARLAIESDELNAALRLLLDKVGEAPRDPSAPEAWLLAGRALTRLGAGAQADPYLARFLELAPLHSEAPSAWHMRAQHAVARLDARAAQDCRDRGQAAARWQAYMQARRLQRRADPRAPLPRLGVAQLWMQVGELQRARAELQELARIAPDFERGWSHLGQVLAALHEVREAFAAFDRALELDPGAAHARLGRGLLALEQGRLELAEADLRRLVDEAGTDPERRLQATLSLARLLLASGRQAEAEGRYARYRELGGREQLAPR